MPVEKEKKEGEEYIKTSVSLRPNTLAAIKHYAADERQFVGKLMDEAICWYLNRPALVMHVNSIGETTTTPYPIRDINVMDALAYIRDRNADLAQGLQLAITSAAKDLQKYDEKLRGAEEKRGKARFIMVGAKKIKGRRSGDFE